MDMMDRGFQRIDRGDRVGFKRVLRAEFAHLEVDERVNSNDDTEFVYRNVMRYIADRGAPAGIYDVAAGNVGIGRALQAEGLAGQVIFIGHELDANSRTLLESHLMHFAIGHDVDREVALAIDYIGALIDKRPPQPGRSAIARLRTVATTMAGQPRGPHRRGRGRLFF